MIRKVRGKKLWRIYSKTKKKGKRKILGTYKSRKKAINRLQQIEFFKASKLSGSSI